MKNYKELGERWRQGISSCGLTTAEVARRLCVIHGRKISRQSIDQIVNGKSPGQSHVEHVAKMLGTTAEYLTNGTGDVPSWAKAAATDRMVRETTALYQAKEAGDQNAAILWELKKISGKLDEHLREDAERWKRIETLLTNLAPGHPAAVGVEPRQVAG